jgi:hypothetical protein
MERNDLKTMTDKLHEIIAKLTSQNVADTARIGELTYENFQLKQEIEKTKKILLDAMLDKEQLQNQIDILVTENDELRE